MILPNYMALVNPKVHSSQPHYSNVAYFAINYLQCIDETGSVVNELPAFAHDPDELLHLFRVMKTLRWFDHKVLMLHRAGKIGTYTGTQGQEAVGAGAGSCLTGQDVLVPYYRSATELYIRGVKLHEILLYWGGDERGCDYQDPRLRDDLPIPISIGSQLPHAAGIALALKLRHQYGRAVLTVIGDGGTSQGDFYEALNAAGAFHLPLVILINNNQWALSEPNADQTGCQTLAQKAVAGGFAGVQVDGNDVIAVKAVTEDALERARNGGGPTLIEAITYRLCAHTTIDNAERYVEPNAMADAQRKEPLLRLRNFLISQGIMNEHQEAHMDQVIKAEVEQEIDQFLNTPIPAVADMFDHMYAELPVRLQQQRNAALAWEDVH